MRRGLPLASSSRSACAPPALAAVALCKKLSRGARTALQALAVGSTTQDEQFAHAIRELKRVAVELNIAVMLTGHTPYLVSTRADPRPTLADLGALGAPAQHADIVLGLFREELYPALQGAEGATELSILKNRNGPSGMYVDLYFYKQWLRFEDMAE